MASRKPKVASIIEKGHGKHSKTTMFDFSEVNGTYFLPYELRAVETDKLQGQEQVAEQSSADKNLQSNDARIQEKDDEEALGIHPKEKHDIIHHMQSSCSPNVFVEVCLASDLPMFRFGHNFIIDASIRKIIISNFQTPMKKGNLLVSNKIVTKHISQYIVPYKETDSDLLLRPRLSLLLYLKFISNWVAFLIYYMACIWSPLRHVCSNYFRFRNLKPRLKSSEQTDANIVSYPKTSG